MLAFGITDHVEGPADNSSAQLYREIIAQTELADKLGFEYAWFAEHHAHAHRGHLPAPLLLALHAAGRTRQIHLGTAILCLNLHHPLAVAEQCAVADHLMQGRGAFGFGSGSTPEEFALFGAEVTEEGERHRHFEAALRTIRAAWDGGRHLGYEPASRVLPLADPSLASRCWLAVNSVGSARIAGVLGFSMLYSHLRTPAQYGQYCDAYRAAGGTGRVAMNRPVHVAHDDATAVARAEPALRTLWRRFQSEGKIPAHLSEPKCVEELCGHPINFLLGSPSTVAEQMNHLRSQCHYDVANLEVRWDGLSQAAIHDCLHLLAKHVRPLLME